MDKYGVIINRHSAYMSRKAIAEEFDICDSQAAKLIKGIKDEIENGRYNPYVVSGSRVNFYAVVDYNKYKGLLKDKNLRKKVPPFDPAAIAEVCGFCQKIVRMEA